jgi:hypothetical protein
MRHVGLMCLMCLTCLTCLMCLTWLMWLVCFTYVMHVTISMQCSQGHL